jgi:hypothetical protein
MPSLEQSLLAHDLALLRAIASQAGIELTSPNARAAAAELAAALKQPDIFELFLARILATPITNNQLPFTNLQSPVSTLLASQGRFPIAAFMRKYGEIRPLGPAALTREQPWKNPATATEALYYNGVIGRAFMDSDTGPQEFFYIPSDLVPLMPSFDSSPAVSAAQAVAPLEADSANAQLASSILVDESVTVLAAVQRYPGEVLTSDDLSSYLHLPVFDFLTALLTELNCITADRKLDPEVVKPLLQTARGEHLRTLCQAWRDSKGWNDLLHVPSLRPEPGAWHNDPVITRNFILKLCTDLPTGEWRSLDSFVAFVRDHHPDFQRPAGDYDSWYIRDAASGDYLRGFEQWEQVDGALVRFLLTGPMHWLGLTDFRSDPDAFRLTPIFTALCGNGSWEISEKPAQILCKHDGTLVVSRTVNRLDRFQAARIGEWVSVGQIANLPYEYCITGTSLQTAADQGITAKHILAFLKRACEHVPEHIKETIERWGEHGLEARASTLLVLKLKEPELLEKLMRFAKTRRYLGEAIGDCAVEVKDMERLREAMLEMGLAVEVIS